MRCTLLASSAVLLAALAAPALAANPPASTNDHVLRIAVVRVGQISHNMQEEKKWQAEFRDRMTQLQQDQQKRGEEINQLTSQLREQLKPGSAQWNDLRATIDKKKTEMEMAKQLGQLQLDRFLKASIKQSYDHIAEAAAQIAEEDHIDLIIADSSPEIVGPDLDAIPYQQLDQMLGSRAVLFANKKADITQDVLTRVDANFAKQNAGGGVTSTGNK